MGRFGGIYDLLELEDMHVEEALQLLVGVVDEQLLAGARGEERMRKGWLKGW